MAATRTDLPRTGRFLLRTLLVWTSIVVGCLLLGRVLVAEMAGAIDHSSGGSGGLGGLDSMTLPALLVLLAETALVACLGWFAVTTSLVVLATVRTAYADRDPATSSPAVPRQVRGCPEWTRRLVLAACGAAIAGTAVGAPVHAETRLVGPPGTREDHRAAVAVDTTAGVPADSLDGLPMPDRASAVAPLRGTPPSRPPEWRVRPGNTLWGIAESVIGRGADAGRVARQWHRIYALNAERVGADPDLLRVGITLSLPTAPTSPGSPGAPDGAGR